jgi:hypothetical protein
MHHRPHSAWRGVLRETAEFSVDLKQIELTVVDEYERTRREGKHLPTEFASD